jgi:hypothetical protein
VLRDLEHEAHIVALDLEGGEDRGELPLVELDVDDGADDLERGSVGWFWVVCFGWG